MTAIKQAVEHYKGVWPYGDKEVIIASTKNANDLNLGCAEYSSYKLSFDVEGLWYQGLEIWKVACTKQQFEDYVRGEKMDKQKYKYVNAGIKTVGELVDSFENGKLFNPEGKEILATFQHEGLRLDWIKFENLDCAPSLLTTRQPLPWYEVEGVFPCLVRFDSGSTYICDGYSIDTHQVNLVSYGMANPDVLTPLTPAQAAEYGVKDD